MYVNALAPVKPFEVSPIPHSTAEAGPVNDAAIEAYTELATSMARPELTAAFDKYWPIKDGSEAVRGLALQKEFRFYKKVMSAALTMSERNPGIVTLLFDVDGTIVDLDGDARPAFGLVVNQLKQILGDRLEVGLITTRKQASLNDEMARPTFTAPIVAAVNPNFFISTYEQEINNPDLMLLSSDKATTHIRRGAVKRIADLAAIDRINATEQGHAKDPWFDSKLVITDRLATEHPDRSFVVIDDALSADAIQANHPNVMGVFVLDERHYDQSKALV